MLVNVKIFYKFAHCFYWRIIYSKGAFRVVPLHALGPEFQFKFTESAFGFRI